VTFTLALACSAGFLVFSRTASTPEKIIFRNFCLGQAVSHPLCQDWRITKANDYDDQRTNGTGAGKRKSVQLHQAATAAVEPGELVVSTDARSGGPRRGLAARPPCPSGANLFSRVIFLWQPRGTPRLGNKGNEARLGCHCIVFVPRCGKWLEVSPTVPPTGTELQTGRAGSERGAPLKDLGGKPPRAGYCPTTA
jgi:hypothetical protein